MANARADFIGRYIREHGPGRTLAENQRLFQEAAAEWRATHGVRSNPDAESVGTEIWTSAIGAAIAIVGIAALSILVRSGTLPCGSESPRVDASYYLTQTRP